MREIISVLSAGLTLLAAGIIKIHVFLLSVLAEGLTVCSAGLFESSVRYSAKAKYRPNEVPLGDFNFKIRHENVDNMN